MKKLECMQTDDALIWAKDFMSTMKENNWSIEDIDEGLMIGWFANAIEVSTDIRATQLSEEDAIAISAGCWCDAETENREMDTALAYAFVKRLMNPKEYKDKLHKEELNNED